MSEEGVAAREAGLRYVSDRAPGIRRRRAGRSFVYVDADGRRVDDEETVARIKSLAIPPAWTDVWICPSPRGHVQATGRDARGRKQYRYHPKWRQSRDEAKYERMMAFGEALPAIRARAEADLAAPGLGREKVLGAVVRLLESTLVRVGNREYARQNRSFGLTTMRDRHATIDGSTLRFQFTGKGGKKWAVGLRDRRLANVVRRCQELPGQELFQYVGEDGAARTVESADVNEYLREISGQEFTAKDFRTWAGTVLAAQALAEVEALDAGAARATSVVRAVEQVAERLGNTPTICRKCYVHPAVIDAFMDGTTIGTVQARLADEIEDGGLSAEEVLVMALLRQRLEEQRRAA
jgi:DNA topoisomerase-1